jgi:DNA-directed RNA polymerase specialized sigma24 family protein
MATTSARALVQAEPSDGELARAAQAGDVASLGALLERYRAPLHAAALRIVGHGSAEDAVQETFVIALRRIGELRDPDAVGGWLHAVLRNVCLMSVRRERAVEPRERVLADRDGSDVERSVEEVLDRVALPFAQAAIARLEDLRLAATELRVEADLRLGRHARLVGELRALVRDHPLRERPCCQLMLALYRDGRQTEALETYRAARGRLVDEVGLEPGPDLQELERQILAQDPALRLDRPRPAPSRAILVLPAHDATIDALVALAEPLAARGGHELLIAALVDDATQVSAAAARLHTVRAGAAERGVTARTAAFSSPDRAADVVRLANDEDVALLLLDAPEELLRAGSPDDVVAGVLAHAACDVALVAGAQRGIAAADAPVLVPFGRAARGPRVRTDRRPGTGGRRRSTQRGCGSSASCGARRDAAESAPARARGGCSGRAARSRARGHGPTRWPGRGRRSCRSCTPAAPGP